MSNNGKLKVVFHDTETTGLELEDRIVSSAFMVRVDTDKFIIREDICNPGIRMKDEASMTNGITNNDIKYAHPFEKTLNYKALKYYNEKNYYYVAYNAYFDLDMLSREGLSWKDKNVIDLYRVTKHLMKNSFIEDLKPSLINKYKQEKIVSKILGIKFPEKTHTPLSNFKLQYLRTVLEFDEAEDFKKLLGHLRIKEIVGHEAKSDIAVMYYFYEYIIKNFKISIDEMIELSHTPVLEEEINFGGEFEHGTKFEDVVHKTYIQKNTGTERSTVNYLDWYVSNTDPMLDRMYSIKYYIAKGIINGKIKYRKAFVKYLNFGILFFFDKKEINKALKIIEKNKEHIKRISKFFDGDEKKFEDASEKTNEIDNYNFLKRYLDFQKNNKNKK